MDCKDWRDVNHCPPKSNVLWWQEWDEHYFHCLSCQKWGREFRRQSKAAGPKDQQPKSSMDCSKFRESTEADLFGRWKKIEELTADELDERDRLLQELGDHQDECAECTQWLDHFLCSTNWGERAEGEVVDEVETKELSPNPLEDPKNAHHARDIYLIMERGPSGKNALRVVRGGSS